MANLPKIAIVVGILLTLEGIVVYAISPTKSPTGLIPAFIGLPILLLGWLGAARPGARQVAMYAATAFAALGLLAAVGRVASAGISYSLASGSIVAMAVITGVFVVLAVVALFVARR
ncbi:MAG: hypothetical protein ACOY3P_18290 [Planctomycetota bacterium]